MDQDKLVLKFKDIIELEPVKTVLIGNNSNNIQWAEIDFKTVLDFDYEVASEYLENTIEFIRNMILTTQDKYPNIKEIIIKNPIGIEEIKINQIRHQYLKKTVQITGMIKRRSIIQPKCSEILYECPTCENRIRIPMKGEVITEVGKCGCGRKGKFIKIEEKNLNYQTVVIEELTDEQQPQSLPMEIEGDYLTREEIQKRIVPGLRVKTQVTIECIEIRTKMGTNTVKKFKAKIIDIIPLDEDMWNIKLNEEKINELKKISQREDLFPFLISHIAPSIYGMENEKTAVLLQSVGGVKKKKKDGTIRRPTVNILIIGDPGTAKSMIGTSILQIVPRSRFVSGRGVSGAGLTAAVVKDELTGLYTLEGGAMVLANKSVIVVDEADKIKEDDITNMHEAMSLNTISISKASINATMPAETAVLGLANPKLGRFDPYAPIADQLNMAPPFLSRFDLIFSLKDTVDSNKDNALADFIYDDLKEEKVFDFKTFREYIIYARQFQPKINNEAYEIIKKYYLELRIKGAAHKTISITPRQIEGMIRLAEASAKLRLSEQISVEDASRSVFLTNYCLSKLGFDPNTGQIDVDAITGSIRQSTVSKMREVLKIVRKYGEENKRCSFNDIVNNSQLQREEVEEVIEKLKRDADIFENPSDSYKVTNR